MLEIVQGRAVSLHSLSVVFMWLQIIECSFDMERKVWIFMRERTDKDTANHRSVFDKVMTSITDNITVSSSCPGKFKLRTLHHLMF